VVQCLPSKLKALCSNPSTAKKFKKTNKCALRSHFYSSNLGGPLLLAEEKEKSIHVYASQKYDVSRTS
jgi:hypothetical protein